MKCAHCPVPEPFLCCALTLPHPPYCWAMDPSRPHHDPRHEPRIVAKSIGREVHPPIDPGPADSQPTATPPVNPYWEQLMLIKGCDYRGPKLGCGCNETRTCWLGKGRAGEVTLNDCLACVSGPA